MGPIEEPPLATGRKDNADLLTKREREILVLIFEGKSSIEVANIISVSKRTVDFHLSRAYEKLNVSNRFQAFKKAIELGLINS